MECRSTPYGGRAWEIKCIQNDVLDNKYIYINKQKMEMKAEVRKEWGLPSHDGDLLQ